MESSIAHSSLPCLNSCLMPLKLRMLCISDDWVRLRLCSKLNIYETPKPTMCLLLLKCSARTCTGKLFCWGQLLGGKNKIMNNHIYTRDKIFSKILSPTVCGRTVTVFGGTGLVLAVEQEGGKEDVSRLLFSSKSFFTVGRVQHGFSFGAGEKLNNAKLYEFWLSSFL